MTKLLVVLALVASILVALTAGVKSIYSSGYDEGSAAVRAEVAIELQTLKDEKDKLAKNANDDGRRKANELFDLKRKNVELSKQLSSLPSNASLTFTPSESGKVSDLFVEEWNRIVERKNRTPTPTAVISTKKDK
jgi:hypothetical protein